jgi:hypothetical protein
MNTWLGLKVEQNVSAVVGLCYAQPSNVMKAIFALSSAITLLAVLSVPGQLAQETGTFSVEDVVPQPISLKVAHEAPIYYQSSMDRVLGSMAPGTIVRLVAMSDMGHFRVRGRARHGDVAGWMRKVDVISKDPNLAANLKKTWDRHVQVSALIEAKQVALGMTLDEVHQSLGKPDKKSSKVTLDGRSDTLEYVTYEVVPQTTTRQDFLGNFFNETIYVKVPTGRMSITFADTVAKEIEEVEGNPLGNRGVQLVPVPFLNW